MKKINTLLIILGLLLVVSCDSDRDSNPAIQVPGAFTLNTPPYASNIIDLLETSTFELTTSQPDYGFTAPAVYSIQVSLDDTWNDATEASEATYATLETTYQTTRLSAVASELARGIVRVSGWTDESEVPNDAMEVYVRLKSHLVTGLYPVYSNSVKLSVIPYFILIKDALPTPYFLIGDCIGDGKWTHTWEGMGSSMYPMSLVEGAVYDRITGKGEFVHTGYFPADKGFKLIGNVGSFDEQWGSSDGSINNLVHNDGGSVNIQVPADGWYTIKLNSVQNTLTIEAVDIQPKSYPSVEIVGDFNNWAVEGAVVLTRSGDENSHVWYGNISFPDTGADYYMCKMRTDADWTDSWNGDGFPYSTVPGTKTNIFPVPGEYIVIFNDLDGCYYFFEKLEE